MKCRWRTGYVWLEQYPSVVLISFTQSQRRVTYTALNVKISMPGMTFRLFFFFFFSTVCVVLVVHYHILSYKINLENFEPNSPLNVYWWHCWSHTMYTDKKEAWTKVMKIKLRGVVIVIPLKFEVWHLKFPSFQM